MFPLPFKLVLGAPVESRESATFIKIFPVLIKWNGFPALFISPFITIPLLSEVLSEITWMIFVLVNTSFSP